LCHKGRLLVWSRWLVYSYLLVVSSFFCWDIRIARKEKCRKSIISIVLFYCFNLLSQPTTYQVHVQMYKHIRNKHTTLIQHQKGGGGQTKQAHINLPSFCNTGLHKLWNFCI
jgi:hypothetical protein